MSSHTLLAVPIIRSDPLLEAQVRAACAGGAELVELRVDRWKDAAAVAELLAQPRATRFILTIRTVEEGGAWEGDEAGRMALFEELGSLGPGYVDVELAAWARSNEVRQAIGRICASCADDSKGRAANRLILSQHDVRGTPADLDAALAPLLACPADVIKAVFTARDATDAWRVLEWLRRSAARRCAVGLAMGEAGLLTRVLAGKFGGFLTFAALDRGDESAPGQPTLEELLGVYRWRAVGPRTGVYGVVGWPVSHSRSPLIHNAAMGAEGIDGVFVPMPVAPGYDDLAGFLDYLSAHAELDVRGLSVTIPHKEHVWRWLREHGLAVSDMALQAGAVNTLARTGVGGWVGDNTDGAGALDALRGVAGLAGGGLRGREVAVLGAGGAARAVIVGLGEENCRVTIFNRTARRAEALAQELRCDWKPWEQRLDWQGDILVNCTSVGMVPRVSASPLPAQVLRAGLVVMDTVYTPAETRLLQDARRRGCVVVSGLEMFIGQAGRQFAAWHGGTAPLAVMREALRAAS